jgi:hypothetical protein
MDLIHLIIPVNMCKKLGRYALWESIANGTVQSKHGWFSF